MGSIRARKDTGMLFFDFIYKGKRCREQTLLCDTAENRRNMSKVLKRIEAEITLGTFEYAAIFPNSRNALKIDSVELQETANRGENNTPTTILFSNFAWEWFNENTVRWKQSYKEMVKSIINGYLIPNFEEKEVGCINKGEVLKFRSSLAKVQNGTKEGLSPDRINHIMTPLRMILTDAADRYNFITPFTGIKPLVVPRTIVDPFSLDEVEMFLKTVRSDFRNYYTVRFFTGLRTAEIDGLKWRYVDFKRREIIIQDTLVKGRVETAKTLSSVRAVNLSKRVCQSLVEQFNITGNKSEYVFCDKKGGPLDYANVTARVWILRWSGFVRQPEG